MEPSIFKANDIRGVVNGPGTEWTSEDACRIGAAYAEISGLAGHSFVLGHDMRAGSAEFATAFAEGAASRSAEPIWLGLTSTDQLWFASGSFNLSGVQFTASHNPAEYTGIKFCLPGAQPVAPDFLEALAHRAHQLVDEEVGERALSMEHRDTLEAYAGYLLSLVPLSDIRPLKVVVDAGNGMAGHTVHAIFDPLPVHLVGLYLDLDGSFPNHPPNPLVPENLRDAKERVVAEGADMGLVFDGDADRCFLIDERGEVVAPSIITALIAESLLRREPGARVVVNTITSTVVAEVVAENGGELLISRVGHTFMKALMAEHDAVFGGEHSAHYYFRDFWGADTGMLAALHVMALVGDRTANQNSATLSELVSGYDRYSASGELNFTVDSVPMVLEAVERAFADRGTLDHIDDGLTVRQPGGTLGAWWFNLRASNTEPLLRLNVEARDIRTMQAIRDDVIDIITTSRDDTTPEETQ